MKSFAVIASLGAIAQTLAQSTLPIVNTPPSLIECQPALISISGGTAPYYISVLPAGQVSATPIEYLPTQAAAGAYTWTVNLAAGTNITISVRDGAGQLNYAAPLVVQAGTDTSCINATASSIASSAGATGATSAAVGGVSSVATTAATATQLVTSAASATASVTAASGTPTSTINGTSATFNFTCGAQGLLTYGITVAELQNVTLAQAKSYFNNWTATAPGVLTNSSGRGVGATRTYTLGGNVTIAETLRLNSTNATTLHQQWNFTTATPVALSSSLTAYNTFDDLTVYTNTTSNTTNIQYFILGCFNDQAAGLTVLASFIDQAVTYWAGQITGSTANSTTAASAAARVRRSVKLVA